MTNRNCTATTAETGNTTYPTLVSNSTAYHIAEDEGPYKNQPTTPLRLSSKDLKAYITERLEAQRDLPVRIHMVLDDLAPYLRQHKKVDVFDLLVELILLADYDPAQYLSALLAVLDDDALIDLEPMNIKQTGEFIRDAMKRDAVRWHLKNYHDEQKGKMKQRKQK